MNHLKLAASAIVVAGLGTTLLFEHRATSTLRDEQEALQQQVEQLTQQATARPHPPHSTLPPSTPVSLSEEQLQELDRLRREIAAVRPPTNELDTLRAENHRLHAASRIEATDDPAETEFKQESRRRIHDLKKWGLLFRIHANDANGQFPTTWEQVADQIPETERAAFVQFASNNFEIVYLGNENAASNRVGHILFREKQARRSPSGKWEKVYGHFDGSASTYSAPDGDFEAWEKQYMIPPKN